MKARKLFDRLDDMLNPIVVKELRQAVQSRIVLAILLLYLAVQVTILGIYVISTEMLSRPDNANYRAGMEIFVVLQSVLVVTCMVAIPCYSAIRLAAERSDTNVDLLFISTLRPRSIMWGKLLSAIVLILLIFCTCAPFMTFTYLLRGIDMPSILVILGADFLSVILGTQLALFLASIPTTRPLRILLALPGIAALVTLLIMTLSGTYALVESGVGGLVDSWDFWLATIGLVALVLGGIGLFFTWSIAAVSPPAANRALPSRVFMIAQWLATLAIAWTWAHHLHMPGPLYAWMFLQVFLFGLQLIISINEREHWGNRVARSIPRLLPLRAAAFLLYSGAAGGVILALLMLASTLTSGCLASIRIMRTPGGPYGLPSRWDINEVLPLLLALCFYTIAYCLSAVFVRRMIGSHRLPALYTWVVGLILLALGSLLPYVIVYMIYFNDLYNMPNDYGWQVTNPFAGCWRMAERGVWNSPTWTTEPPMIFCFLWAVGAILLNLPWLVRQFASFRRPRPIPMAVLADEGNGEAPSEAIVLPHGSEAK